MKAAAPPKAAPTNPFESGQRKVIPSTLIYVFCDEHLLMLFRNKKTHDIHMGKWNGLGGKFELGESPREAALRELFEESAIQLQPEQLQPLGHLYFPNFKAAKEQDWSVHVFIVELTRAEVAGHFTSSKVNNNEIPLPSHAHTQREGELKWVHKSQVLTLPLWEGDLHFLPFVLSKEPFMGCIHYINGRFNSYEIQSLMANTSSPTSRLDS